LEPLLLGFVGERRYGGDEMVCQYGGDKFLPALGHCCEIQTMGNCQRACLRDLHKDYAEESGRIVGTTFALGFNDLAAAARDSARRPGRFVVSPRRISRVTCK